MQLRKIEFPLTRFSATEAPDLASLEHFSLSPLNVAVKEKVFHSLMIAAAGRCDPAAKKESSSSPQRKISFKSKDLTAVCDEGGQQQQPPQDGTNLNQDFF